MVIGGLTHAPSTSGPGPDRLPAEYYKELEEVLLQPFKKLLECVEEEGKIPATWTEAIISLTHKENTEGKEIQNYRPISLSNVDYKIYATILAIGLKRILIHLIHQDQSGFLLKRQMNNNIRIVLNSLEYYEAPRRQISRGEGTPLWRCEGAVSTLHPLDLQQKFCVDDYKLRTLIVQV